MGKIRNTNKRSEPSDRLPWGTKISKIRRQNKAFQSSFHFDGNMAVPKPDVVTHGIGEAGEESDNTKSIDGEKKTGSSPDSTVTTSFEATLPSIGSSVGAENSNDDVNSTGTKHSGFPGNFNNLRTSNTDGHPLFGAKPLPSPGGPGQLRSSLLDSLYHDRQVALRMLAVEGDKEEVPESSNINSQHVASVAPQWAPQPEIVHGHFGNNPKMFDYQPDMGSQVQPAILAPSEHRPYHHRQHHHGDHIGNPLQENRDTQEQQRLEPQRNSKDGGHTKDNERFQAPKIIIRCHIMESSLKSTQANSLWRKRGLCGSCTKVSSKSALWRLR